VGVSERMAIRPTLSGFFSSDRSIELWPPWPVVNATTRAFTGLSGPRQHKRRAQPASRESRLDVQEFSPVEEHFWIGLTTCSQRAILAQVLVNYGHGPAARIHIADKLAAGTDRLGGTWGTRVSILDESSGEPTVSYLFRELALIKPTSQFSRGNLAPWQVLAHDRPWGWLASLKSRLAKLGSVSRTLRSLVNLRSGER